MVRRVRYGKEGNKKVLSLTSISVLYWLCWLFCKCYKISQIDLCLLHGFTFTSGSYIPEWGLSHEYLQHQMCILLHSLFSYCVVLALLPIIQVTVIWLNQCNHNLWLYQITKITTHFEHQRLKTRFGSVLWALFTYRIETLQIEI